jgi:hypothetical protein
MLALSSAIFDAAPVAGDLRDDVVAAMLGAWEVFLTGSRSAARDHTRAGHGEARAHPWSAVRGVQYSRLGSWFIFQAPGFPTVRVSIYRSGLRTFAIAADRGLASGPSGGRHTRCSRRRGIREAIPIMVDARSR